MNVPTETIYILIPNYDYEGYGEPYGEEYFTDKKQAEEVQANLNKHASNKFELLTLNPFQS
mgnify:CR=1 FL=1